MLQRLTQTILKNRYFGIGAVFLCALPNLLVNPENQVLSAIASLITTMSIVIAAFITLEKGWLEGFFATVVATIPSVASFFIYPLTPDAYFGLNLAELSGLIILNNYLTWVYAVYIRIAGNWSKLLQFTTYLSILILISIYVLYPQVEEFWMNNLTRYLDSSFKLMDQLRGGGDGSSGSLALQGFVNTAKVYATGFVIMMFMANILFQLGLARLWQAAEFSYVNLTAELYNIHLGNILGSLFVMGLLLSIWHVKLILAIMPIFYLIFAIAGLSLLHYVASLVKGGKIWLGVSYFFMIILPTVFIVLIAMVGLLDTWMNLRVKAQEFFKL